VAERYVFSVRYDEAVMKAAVWKYVLRTAFLEHTWYSVLAIFGVLGCALLLFVLHDLTFGAGLFAGLVASIALLFVYTGWAHWQGMRAKLRRMKEPKATFRLSDDDVSIEADSGSSRLPWTTIKDIWRFDRVWLLMLASNQFVTLPLQGAPSDALAFLNSKIAPTRL
jgi:hypothetical protein